jgi:arginine-tRNA-protein transferase
VARQLQHIVEDPRPCSYLTDARASLEVRVLLDVAPAELDAMLERGWRRFGPAYFRPVCPSCGECVTLRILVSEFRPNKSQRRAAKAAARLRRVVATPSVDSARLALYERWHNDREASRGWEPSMLDAERYRTDFAFPHPCAREVAFYDDDANKLVGVGLCDETPRAFSAAYFYYDPDYAKMSLGTANVLALVEDARRSNKPHVYLGYRVRGCASLAYKEAFRPHELLVGRPAFEARAEWRTAIPK